MPSGSVVDVVDEVEDPGTVVAVGSVVVVESGVDVVVDEVDEPGTVEEVVVDSCAPVTGEKATIAATDATTADEAARRREPRAGRDLIVPSSERWPW